MFKSMPNKRFWKRLVLTLLIVVAVGFIANGIMAWRTAAQLEDRVEAIRAQGDPASIADLAPKPVAADENAAAVLEELTPRLDEFSQEYARFLHDSPLGQAFEIRRRSGQLPARDQIEAIRAFLDAYGDLQSGIRTAATCQSYASLADFELEHRAFLEGLLQKTSRIRTAARYVEWRITVLIADQQYDQAVEQGTELLRLARLYNAEPALVNYLVGIAIRAVAANAVYDALASGPVLPALRNALDEELALHDDPQQMVQVIKEERAIGVGSFEAMMPTSSPIISRVLGWPLKRYYLGVLKLYDAQLELADQAESDRRSPVLRESAPQTPTGFGVFSDLLVPGLESAYEANARITAQLRALRIFNALTQFREKRGREATGLEELPMPEEATIDPFSGEPLKLKKTEDGWIVYSVMQNGSDDGGEFRDLLDYGVAPRSWKARE